MSFSAEPKVAVLQGNTQAADPAPHPHGPKLAPKLSQEGKRQLWSSGITASRDSDIGAPMGLWGHGGAAVRILGCHEREVQQAGLVRKHPMPFPGTAPQASCSTNTGHSNIPAPEAVRRRLGHM